MTSQPNYNLRLIVTLWAFLENILFAGLRAGWPALVYVLKQKHIYSEVCDGDNIQNISVNVNLSKPIEMNTQDLNLYSNYEIANRSSITNVTFGNKIKYLNDIISSRTLFETNDDRIDSVLNSYSDGDVVVNLNMNITNTPRIDLKEGCDEQDAIFQQCFTIATATMALSALLYGQLNYKFGIRAPRLLSVIIFIGGCFCFAFIDTDSPWLIYPGLLLISSGGMALYITNNQVSYMYGKGGAAVIGLLVGALEASSFVMHLIKIAYEGGVDLKISYLVLAGLYLGTIFSTFCLLPKDFVQSIASSSKPDEETGNTDERNTKVSTQGEISFNIDEFSENDKNSLENSLDTKYTNYEMNFDSNENSFDYKEILRDCKCTPDDCQTKNNYQNDNQQNGNKNRNLSDLTETSHVGGNSHLEKSRSHESETSSSPNTSEDRPKTLMKCILSKTFCLYLFWASVVQITLAMALGTFNPWLENILDKDKDKVSEYTGALYYTMVASPLLALAIGMGMDKLKTSNIFGNSSSKKRGLLTACTSLAVTSLTSVAICVCMMFTIHDIIIVTCVVLVIFRTCLYSCGTAFIRILYPTEYFGMLCGLVSLLAGGFSFLQKPLFLWVQSSGDGWLVAYGFLGILNVLSLVQPVYLFIKARTIS